MDVTRTFHGKVPNTSCRLTRLYRTRLAAYGRAVDDVRRGTE